MLRSFDEVEPGEPKYRAARLDQAVLTCAVSLEAVLSVVRPAVDLEDERDIGEEDVRPADETSRPVAHPLVGPPATDAGMVEDGVQAALGRPDRASGRVRVRLAPLGVPPRAGMFGYRSREVLTRDPPRGTRYRSRAVVGPGRQWRRR